MYKALDLSEMRLVALKVVPVFERGKRRQMKKELTTLFQMLRWIATANSSNNTNNNTKTDGVATVTEFESESELSIPQVSNSRVRNNVSRVRNKELYDFIVNFYDAFSVLDEGGVAMMMEYMDGGSLQDIVDSGGCDDENTLCTIALQGLMGLKFLHDCNQIHRDLKPGNLLINKRGDVKVADLGILKQLDGDVGGVNVTGSGGGGQTDATTGVETGLDNENEKNKSPTLARTSTFVGTATYMSPERINGHEYSFPSDVWAFGLSIMAVAIGKLPIHSKGGYWSILQSIRDAPSPTLPPNTTTAEGAAAGHGIYWSDDFRSFLKNCLQKEPADRLSCSELLQHPFVLQAQILMENNVTVNDSNTQDVSPSLMTHDGSILYDENGVGIIPEKSENSELPDTGRTPRLSARFSPVAGKTLDLDRVTLTLSMLI